ncbi:MAG: phage-shock protein [Desulfobacteraceae bacterium]|nr:phage-shock protein [Desulfobacteraceae bacterium]
MHGVIALSIIFGGSILILAIIGSTILMAIKIFKETVSKRGQQNQTDEAKMIQEIYKGLSQMEERLEALETIILDRERKDRVL